MSPITCDTLVFSSPVILLAITTSLFLVGVFSQLGQVFLTNALQREKVAGVAIVNYTGLIYALIIGSVVFGEEQSTLSMSGMLLVVFGVLLSVLYGRRLKELDKIEATAA